MKKLLLVLILVSFTNFIFAGIDDDIFDVRDFGENVGTGDKNVDTAALLKAISTADSAGGGSVYISENMTLLLNKPVCMPQNTRLFSIGMGATLKFMSVPGSDACILIIDQSNIIIENLDVICDNLTKRITALEIRSDNDTIRTSEIKVKKCYIRKLGNLVSGDMAIWIRGGAVFSNCQYIIIEDCKLQHFFRGIVITRKAELIDIINNHFYGIKSGGIYVGCTQGDYCRKITVKRNTLSELGGIGYSGYPIFFTTNGNMVKNDNIRVFDNNIFGNFTYFDADSTDGNADMIAMYDCKNSFVRGNHVSGGGDIGICLWRSKRVIVTENIVSCNNTKGIAVYASDNCLIANNIVYNNCLYAEGLPIGYKRVGIFVHNYGVPPVYSTYNYIVGNRCYDDRVDENKTQDYGVYITKNNCHNHIGTNFLEGNKIAPIVICEPTTTRDYVISSGCVNCEK